MNHIKFLAITFLGITFLSCQPKEEKEDSKPNILWIVSEDNSPFLGAYGDDYATTPNLDQLAAKGILYHNAFAPAPVCAPTRSSIITGMYANSLGTHQMRSNYPIPAGFKFYPELVKAAGYYCTNNSKKDYNTLDHPDAWDESGKEAHYKNRKKGQPFFHIFNFNISHESSIHKFVPNKELKHDPESAPIPPYHPKTPEMKHDWAQYYDKVEMMDAQVGKVLVELKESGLEENTIVIYYSDHGGVLGRSKRFMYESGLRVPLIVYLPEKYQHLSKEKVGSETDRIVNLMDMGPTLLNILDIEIPANMQGTPFLGKKTTEKEYAYGFRGRMDERFDLVRSVRNKKFRYIRNYMPHRIYGQYIEYLWKAPSMKSWEQAYLDGELNEIQSAFWKEKPAEELFEISTDPHNVNNLANDPKYTKVLTGMRTEGLRWQKEILDIGFIPEPMIERISADMPLYEYVRKDEFPFDRIMETADIATRRDSAYMDTIINRLEDTNPAVRYWSLIGCVILNKEARKVKDKIKSMTKDEEVAVRIAAAEALYKMGEKQLALNTLTDCLKSEYQMGRTMALNVMDLMGEDARAALPQVEKIASEKLTGLTYDVRAAKRIVEKLQ
ncbi:sulfatase-like hydrolase/transferase [Reichenbachiella sp. MALMAid0571]|uniref:sulfatase-like hydrolase/transferase n=1 Tax=Reichenbachiella sp. MALMAid0571 TaxID=3143939 RepID=UPI0032E01965